jgi:hypothetical protein
VSGTRRGFGSPARTQILTLPAMRFDKMRTTRLTLLIILTIVTVDSFACTCYNKRDHKKLFKNSDFVFIGQALNNLNRDSIVSKLLDLNGQGGNISFKVERVFKGKIEKEIIAIIQNGGSCSMLFKLGDKYLVFGTRRDQLYDSMGIYTPIIRLDSTDTTTDNEVIQYRLNDFKEDKNYETKIKDDFGLIIDTNLCACYYSTGKTFKKYMRRKTHSWQQNVSAMVP